MQNDFFFLWSASLNAQITNKITQTLHNKHVLPHIPGVNVGDEFMYRAEMYLVGLHDDLIYWISLGMRLVFG
jgi:hypothetical protein